MDLSRKRGTATDLRKKLKSEKRKCLKAEARTRTTEEARQRKECHEANGHDGPYSFTYAPNLLIHPPVTYSFTHSLTYAPNPTLPLRKRHTLCA